MPPLDARAVSGEERIDADAEKNMARKDKISRNQPCPCGSGKKFKKCCGSVGGRLVEPLALPAPTMPEPMTFEELQDRIRQLKSMVERYNTLSILMSCFFSIQKIDWEHPERAGMMSPYKQCTYIASLALATPEAPETEELHGEKWNKICAVSGEIFNYYGLMYFHPETVRSARESEEQHSKTGAAMAAFMYWLGSGIFATVEQMREDIQTLYSPFDAEVASRTGLHIKEFIDVSTFIVDMLDRRIAEGHDAIMNSWMAFRKQSDDGIDLLEAANEARAKLGTHNFSQFNLLGQVTLDELQSAFPGEKIDSYLAFVSQERASADADFLFPSEQHLIEQKPLVLVRPDTYHLITGNLLFLSILRGLEALLRSDRAIDQRFNRHKGKVLEKHSLSIFQDIFGDEASYFEQVYETEHAHNEHDILIFYKDILFVVECKAKGIRKNFRDVDRAIERITSDFKSYIQEGFDQANKLKNLILSQGETPLYNQKGKEVLRIEKTRLKQIACICVTKESEGPLATNLSLLLEKEPGDEYPYCISLYDLRQLAEYKDQFGITPAVFADYVAQRNKIQGKAFTDDELDLWGYFLKHKGFENIVRAPDEIVMIPLSYSSMFDKAYRNSREYGSSSPEKWEAVLLGAGPVPGKPNPDSN